MLVVGLWLIGWNTWQRLGRTPTARSWADPDLDRWYHRKVLVAWPGLAFTLLCGAGLGVAPRESLPAYLLALGVVAGLLVFFAYFFLPLPVPRALQPEWYRRRRVSARVR